MSTQKATLAAEIDNEIRASSLAKNLIALPPQSILTRSYISYLFQVGRFEATIEAHYQSEGDEETTDESGNVFLPYHWAIRVNTPCYGSIQPTEALVLSMLHNEVAKLAVTLEAKYSFQSIHEIKYTAEQVKKNQEKAEADRQHEFLDMMVGAFMSGARVGTERICTKCNDLPPGTYRHTHRSRFYQVTVHPDCTATIKRIG